MVNAGIGLFWDAGFLLKSLMVNPCKKPRGQAGERKKREFPMNPTQKTGVQLCPSSDEDFEA
jgi:hypothetical protein